MSVFGPKQSAELFIGNAVAAAANTTAFRAGAAVGELKAVGAYGGAIAADEKFKILQKTAGDAGKNLDVEFSGVIDPAKVDYVTVRAYAPEIQKQVTVSGLTGAVEADTTYEVFVRIYNEGGSLSVENFVQIQGSYVTNRLGTDTFADVINGIVENINDQMALRGQAEIVASGDAVAGTVTITGVEQPVVAGKITGKQIEFEVIAKVVSNVADPTRVDLSETLTVTIDQVNVWGLGTYKDAINYEWFVKGYDYEPYRQAGYPNDFSERTPFYSDPAGQYNVIAISHYKGSEAVSEERQFTTTSIFVDDQGGVAATNAVLADLRTVLGTAKVPADLV